MHTHVYSTYFHLFLLIVDVANSAHQYSQLLQLEALTRDTPLVYTVRLLLVCVVNLAEGSIYM